MTSGDKYLYCNFATFAYLQKLVYVDIMNKQISTVGKYETSKLAEAICAAAEKGGIDLVVLEGNEAYLKKIAEEIRYINNNLKVEVNPYHNEISY